MSTTIRFHSYGPPSVLQVEDERVPSPTGSQVKLRHEAIGVNFIDTIFRRGIYPTPLPSVPGVEGAGVIVEVGPDATGFSEGERVAYFLAPGAYARERLISSESLVRIPGDITTKQAASILTKGLTAWAALNGYYKLKPGDVALIQGASSAVGGLLARWARSLGAVVIGTSSPGAKLPALADYVDHAFAYGDPEIARTLSRVAPAGADVVYEFVGKATFAHSLAAVKQGGTIANIGAASGAPEVDSLAIARREVRIVGGPMAQHLQGPALQSATAAVFDAFRKGVFGELEVSEYPLENAREAHEAIEARTRSGLLLLIPAG